MARSPAAALAVAALLAALAWAAPARAANYELAIDAPEELIEPLRERTLLGRWRDGPVP